MKTFFAKKIRILGKSISLALIIGLVLVVGLAAAAFFSSVFTIVNITAGSGPGGSFNNLTCEMIAGPGTVNTCEISAGSITVDISDATNDSVFKVSANYMGVGVYQSFSFVPTLLAGVSSATCATPNGTIFPAGVGDWIHTTVALGDLQPEQIISGPIFEYRFTAQ